MRQPDLCIAPRALLVVVALLSMSATAEVPEELAENWYRTEVLIFVREDAESQGAEQWDPLPVLDYPERYRYLLDSAMADRRFEESLAFESRIDAQGKQTLRVPAPIEELLDHNRPDTITVPLPEGDGDLSGAPDEALDELLPADEDSVDPLADVDPNGPSLDPDDPLLDPNEPTVDLTSPVLSLPYELLDRDSLEFRAQARSLRRRGQRVMFHGSWWAMLDEQEATPALIIDRSGDMDSTDWPALQGSLQIYRSRYLHIVLDLWLNTLGDYLPAGWQIDAPPLAPASLTAKTLGGNPMDPWAPAPEPENMVASEAPLTSPIAGGDAPQASPSSEEIQTGESSSEDILESPPYPWRHAIVHRQTRRMRSGEIHYLDHPVIGVIVKITPMSEDALPLRSPELRDFRERHALPVEVLPPSAEESVDKER